MKLIELLTSKQPERNDEKAKSEKEAVVDCSEDKNETKTTKEIKHDSEPGTDAIR